MMYSISQVRFVKYPISQKKLERGSTEAVSEFFFFFWRYVYWELLEFQIKPNHADNIIFIIPKPVTFSTCKVFF